VNLTARDLQTLAGRSTIPTRPDCQLEVGHHLVALAIHSAATVCVALRASMLARATARRQRDGATLYGSGRRLEKAQNAGAEPLIVVAPENGQNILG
jgi:hypothetical protein